MSLHAPNRKSLSQALSISRQLAMTPVAIPVNTTTTHGLLATHNRTTTPRIPGVARMSDLRSRSRAYSCVQSIELPPGTVADAGGRGAVDLEEWSFGLSDEKMCFGKLGKPFALLTSGRRAR